jgi:hypothetical protein
MNKLQAILLITAMSTAVVTLTFNQLILWVVIGGEALNRQFNTPTKPVKTHHPNQSSPIAPFKQSYNPYRVQPDNTEVVNHNRC